MSRRETNARLRDPIMVRSTSSGLSICYYCSFGFFWIIFYPSPHYKALPFYLITSPVPTCLVYNCETSRRFAIPICCHPCLRSNSLWSPITVMEYRALNEITIKNCYPIPRIADLIESLSKASVTNFIRSYLHQFFDDSHGLKASLKPLKRPFDRCQSRLEAINNGRDIKQINW